MNAPRALPRRGLLGRVLAVLSPGTWLGALGAAPAEATPQATQAFLGEIRMFAGSFAPSAWALCNGQSLPIAGNEPLFTLLGTTYGGDGVTDFWLPDLRGRVPIHFGQGPGLSNHDEGEISGVETVTLLVNQIPAHAHVAGASSANGSSDSPAGLAPARNAAGVPEFGATANTTLASGALVATGNTQAHTNLQPFLSLNFIICLEGLYPSRD